MAKYLDPKADVTFKKYTGLAAPLIETLYALAPLGGYDEIKAL